MSTTPCDLIIEARWLLPIAPRNEVLEHAAMAVRDGRILALGSPAELDARYRPASRVSLPQHVLLPGLVNAHGHAAMTLLRGYAEDAPLQEWLQDKIWPLEARLVDAAFVRTGTRLALAEMLRSGTTCFSDMYFFPEVVGEEARQAGMRCQLAFPVIRFANAWSTSAEDAVHRGLALHDAYRGNPLVRVAFGPHAAYSVTREDLEKILMYSEELDANVHIHLHENAAEVEEVRRQERTTWVRRLSEIGLVNPRLQAVHATQLDAEEIEILAAGGAHVVHCPHSNLKLVSGVCPTSALSHAGVNVALGTDGAASNNGLDLLQEARLASLLAKLDSGDARSLPEARALSMATLGGARALGREQEIGSLEPGKLADCIAVNLNHPRFQPVHDPMAQLVHTGAGSAVSHVWVGGRALVNDGHLTSIDEAAVLADVAAWNQRLRSSA